MGILSSNMNKRLALIVVPVLVALTVELAGGEGKKEKPRHYPLDYCAYEAWKKFAVDRKFGEYKKPDTLTFREQPVELIQADTAVFVIQSWLHFSDSDYLGNAWSYRFQLTYTGDTLLNWMLLDTFYWDCEELKVDWSKER